LACAERLRDECDSREVVIEVREQRLGEHGEFRKRV
jgi:hypothetical protein